MIEIPKKTSFWQIALSGLLIVVTVATLVTAAFSIRSTHISAESCEAIAAPLPTWLTNAVNANKPAYTEVSNQTGVPWELLASIHYRETSFGKTNPGNGQGIFQFVNGEGGPYPPGPVSDAEFTRQLKFMATKIQNDYVYRGSLNYSKRPLTPGEPDIYRIKDTLFSYNGRSSLYASQATKYGYDSKITPYEGSPYVMNMFDCKRVNMGLITRDYGGIDGIDTRYGAFTLYARLKGDAYWSSLASGNLPGCHEATNTTLTCVWKLTNPANGATVMTDNYVERNTYVAQGYLYSGTAFFGINSIAGRPSNIPVYKLTKGNGETFLTTDQNERSVLIAAYGYKDGGIGFYADRANSNSGYPVWRLYNHAKQSHIWSKDNTEIEALKQAGYVVENQAFTSVSSTRLEDAAPAGQMLVYRFSNMPGNSHFWTTNVYERDSMIKSGYRYEGVAWKASQDITNIPVYRLYSPTMRKHLYTTDKNERDVLSGTSSWQAEGIAFYSSPAPTSQPIYRLYSPITKNHLLTNDTYERQVLIGNRTFQDEGIAYYAY